MADASCATLFQDKDHGKTTDRPTMIFFCALRSRQAVVGKSRNAFLCNRLRFSSCFLRRASDGQNAATMQPKSAGLLELR
jgi:hypothetical protein